MPQNDIATQSLKGEGKNVVSGSPLIYPQAKGQFNKYNVSKTF